MEPRRMRIFVAAGRCAAGDGGSAPRGEASSSVRCRSSMRRFMRCMRTPRRRRYVAGTMPSTARGTSSSSVAMASPAPPSTGAAQSSVEMARTTVRRGRGAADDDAAPASPAGTGEATPAPVPKARTLVARGVTLLPPPWRRFDGPRRAGASSSSSPTNATPPGRLPGVSETSSCRVSKRARRNRAAACTWCAGSRLNVMAFVKTRRTSVENASQDA
mmetsp:Transcript_10162/g.33603  ORF Transcript_10162/g.33603 Transcript_10162/m.33603 type:complete len:217 (-) Transcript_10162:303-953(-)